MLKDQKFFFVIDNIEDYFIIMKKDTFSDKCVF